MASATLINASETASSACRAASGLTKLLVSFCLCCQQMSYSCCQMQAEAERAKDTEDVGYQLCTRALACEQQLAEAWDAHAELER